MSQRITNAQLRSVTGISASYASMILNGKRPCPSAIALSVFRATGHRIGALENATDEEIEIFERLSGDHAATDTIGGAPPSPGNSPTEYPSQQDEAA